LTTETPDTKLLPGQILDALFELPNWPERPGEEPFNQRYLKLLTELALHLSTVKPELEMRPKVFIYQSPDQTIIESTAAVDVILAQVGMNPKNPVLTSEALTPLPEEEFHQTICDLLALEVQCGRISPMEINEKLQ